MKYFFMGVGAILIIAQMMGCESFHAINEPVTLEQDFGKSVQPSIVASVFDIDAYMGANTAPVMGLEGHYGQNVMEAHRYVANPENVIRSEVTFKR